MRILLYGGTFDPPHNGHLHNLSLAAARVRPNRVIVMPAGVPPHKAASTTPAALRLEMCGCFREMVGTKAIPQLEVSDWEIHQAEKGIKNYTDTTVSMLAETYPGAKIYLAVGSDMLLSFDHWHQWQHLLASCQLVAVSRECDDRNALWEQAARLDPTGARILFAADDAMPMASSQLRAALQRGEDCTKALPESVQRIIAREGLYLPMETQNHSGLTLAQAQQLAKSRLGEKRYRHTENVKNLAVELAQIHGENPDKAALAAWLHDTAKEMPKAELLQILQDNAIIKNNPAARPEPVWHGICAAILAQTQWGVQDQEVLDAVECHTTGRPGMTKLDKILFLADMTSAERSWPGVEELRCLAKEDLDAAMLSALDHTISFVQQQGSDLDPMSIAAYEDLKKQTEGNHEL